MKLVVTVDALNANKTKFESQNEIIKNDISTLSSISFDCKDSAVRTKLEELRENIKNKMNELIEATNNYYDKINQCTQKYSENEEDIKTLDLSEVIKALRLKIPGLLYNNGGLNIPQFYQQNYGNVKLGSSNVANDGCGWASCAMVATYLTGTVITPEDIASWSQGYYDEGNGMYWSLPEAVAEQYSLGTVTQTSSLSDVKTALQNGQPVICSQNSNGQFTNGGHIIVLRGVDENGNILVNDPNSYNAEGKGFNNKSFTDTEISEGASTYWIYQ